MESIAHTKERINPYNLLRNRPANRHWPNHNHIPYIYHKDIYIHNTENRRGPFLEIRTLGLRAFAKTLNTFFEIESWNSMFRNFISKIVSLRISFSESSLLKFTLFKTFDYWKTIEGNETFQIRFSKLSIIENDIWKCS